MGRTRHHDRRSLSESEERELAALADLFAARLDSEKLEAAESVVEEMIELAGADEPEAIFAQAELAWHRGGAKAAMPLLERALMIDRDFVAAHHALAQACEERNDFGGMVAHFLEVLRIDEARDEETEPVPAALLETIEARVVQVLDALPEHLRDRIGDVPVMLEPRPSREMVEAGLDPRAFGLFEGEDERAANGAGIERHTVPPTRVVIYYANLLEAFFGQELLEEVEITVMHELAHFLGLDEDEVADLGLA